MSDVNRSNVDSVARELDSPLCEAPECYRRALIRALEPWAVNYLPTDWRGFAEYFNIEVAASSPEELVSHWADSHPNHKHHTIQKVFEYAEATQHHVLLQEFHASLRDLESFIELLSRHIGGDWKALARKLELSKTDIDAVHHDNCLSLKEQIFQFFEKWKRQEGKNASIHKLVSGLMDAKLEEPLRKMREAVFSGECDKRPHQVIVRSKSEPTVSEQKPKVVPAPRTSLSVRVHIHPQQKSSNQHCENPKVNDLDTDSSTQPHTSSSSPTPSNSPPPLSPPPFNLDASSQMPNHEDDPEPRNAIRQRRRSEDERKDDPGDSFAVDPKMDVNAFLQRRFQTKPYTLFIKYYKGEHKHRTREVVGVIFLVFFVFQALASFLVTICEDCEFWNALRNGKEVYINILHRCLLFTLRISVRVIAPLCSLIQLHWIAVKPQLTSKSSDKQEPDNSLSEFEGSLQRRIESTWISVLHAVLFPILLLSMGAFAGVEESITKAKVCNFTDSSIVAVPLNAFIQLSDCISAIVILLVMGLAKDCYCYENEIVTHLLNLGDPGKNMRKEIRNRWLILDMYCYITSVGFTVFTGLSIFAGKAFTPDPSQDLEVGDLVTWYVWISFLSLLLGLGSTSHRYVKGAGLVCYSLALIFVLAGKLPIHVPPGSSIILYYIALGMSVFNLLVCLFCSRCHQKKSKEPFSFPLFVLCLFCLLLLPVSGMAMLVREVIHFAHFA